MFKYSSFETDGLGIFTNGEGPVAWEIGTYQNGREIKIKNSLPFEISEYSPVV